MSTDRPEDLPRLQRASGSGRLATQQHEGRTRILELYQEGCAKIRLPATHTNALEAVLINTSGGLTGGDRLSWSITANAGAKLVLTTQACERIYKSSGGAAHVETSISIGAGAHVDWLPQETMLFENANLDRKMNVELGEGASFTALEAVLLGRQAMGEEARSAIFNDQWRITRNGKLIHAEANRLSATDLERDALSLLAGNNAFATLVHIHPQAELKLDRVRDLRIEGGLFGASAIGERLIVRVLAPTGLVLRRMLTPIIHELSGAGSLPRIWTT